MIFVDNFTIEMGESRQYIGIDKCMSLYGSVCTTVKNGSVPAKLGDVCTVNAIYSILFTQQQVEPNANGRQKISEGRVL